MFTWHVNVYFASQLYCKIQLVRNLIISGDNSQFAKLDPRGLWGKALWTTDLCKFLELCYKLWFRAPRSSFAKVVKFTVHRSLILAEGLQNKVKKVSMSTIVPQAHSQDWSVSFEMGSPWAEALFFARSLQPAVQMVSNWLVGLSLYKQPPDE